MGILRRTHRLLLLLTILAVAGVLRSKPVRSKRQAVNPPWNYFTNFYRQRFMNRQRLSNNQLVGPRRGPLLTTNQRQPVVNNQRLFNNRRVSRFPSNYPMNNRFLNNFGQNRRRMFMPWRNNRLFNQGPLMIPGQIGVVPYTPPQDPTDAPEFINGVWVTELPEPPDPTDPPEIPLAQSPQIPSSNPYANMFWQGYRDPTFLGQGVPLADPTDPPDPPEMTDPPEFFPAAAPFETTLAPAPTPVPQATPTALLAPKRQNTPARILPGISPNQRSTLSADGSPVNQTIETGTPPTLPQVGPWASQPSSSPIAPEMIFADTVTKTTQDTSILTILEITPLATQAVEATVSPSFNAVTPAGVSYMYSPRKGYNPTWTMGTNLAPWQRVMWNRMLYNV